MKANVIHGDFNPCGGAERLALVTMQSLLEMGIDFDLTTLKSPDISKLENSYGKKLVSVMKSINKINIINILEELRHQKQQQQQLQLQKQQQQQKKNHNDYNYDITINTNGDAAPYYHPSFSKDNTITYCHFPSTKYHIDSESIDYLKTDLGLTEQSIFLSHHKEFEDSISNSKNYKTRLQFNNNSRSSGRISEYYELIKYGYWNLMRNSTVITNSEFSRRTIVDAMGLDNIYILNPPIDIETFHNVALTSDSNNNNNNNNPSNNIILVIARIAPHKKIENAIKLAKILKDNNIGKGMKIVGNLYYYFFDYYSEIKQMVLDLDLTDYITFEINANLDKLLSIIRESRIYFHPMIGEHFGISVLEAMAAGLIPVVPNEGGVKEFVPSKYQFNSIEHAAEIIKNIFNHLPNKEQIQTNNNINKFSSSHYIKEFQIILNKLLYQRKLQ